MAISNFAKLWLLMEKNFRLQWRHKIRTLLYVLLPVLIAVLIVVLRYFVRPNYREILSTSSFSVLNVRGTPLRPYLDKIEWQIAYSPNTPLITTVVQDAVDRLIEYDNTLIPTFEEPMNISITPYASSSYLESIYMDPDNVNRIFAGIQFDDSLIGQTSLPSNLEVSLRFPMRPRDFLSGSTWHTDISFPSAFNPGPRNHFNTGGPPDYMREGFLALQHAVSTAITQTINGSRELFDELDIEMQRFPHPSYFNDFFIAVLPMMMLLLFLIGFSFQAVNIIRSIVEEKEKQLKEAMKIMGLSTWHHWTAWFLNQYFLILISVILLVILFKIPVLPKEDSDGVFVEFYAFVESIEASLFIVFLLLYTATLVTFSFMMSTFFDKESKVSTVSNLVWLLMFLPSVLITIPGTSPSLFLHILVCFSFNSALSAAFSEIALYGSNSMVLTWSNMFSPFIPGHNFVFGYVMVMLLADLILYLLIALYVEKVFPGEYGVAQPWYFLFTRKYWGLTQETRVNEEQESLKHEGLISENDPVGMNVGVDIRNLTKVYNDEKVVDNINLKIFEDQITILLGHNGAGKSTTLSMITGMITPTSGTALLGGYDIRNQTNLARASLGLCPQHNILFSGLTVEEHLRFYSRLKGLSKSEVKEETERFISLLDLVDKRHNLSTALSGGQQRKLSVGIALCGKSKLVFLDEPSSGLDPSARRGLWEILQKEKIGRTIIMTTHFMDEAEILGDRVGIMSAGQMKCIGSPFFLKQQYKLGYTLSIVKGINCNILGITRLLERYIPGLKPPADIGSELAFMLPHGSSHQFEALLGELEYNQAALGVHSYGLSASALEEVFLKVGADAQSIRQNVGHNGVTAEAGISYTTGPYTVTGQKLILNHVRATLLKRLLTSGRSWMHPLIQIVVPFVIILSSIFTNINFAIMDVASLDARTLSLQNGFIRTNTLMTSTSSLPQPQQAIADAYESSFGESDSTILTNWGNVDMSAQYLIEVPENMRALRFENMIGVSFRSNAIVAWFSSFSFHDEAIALAYLDNAILRSISPSSSLTFINHPIAVSEDDTETTGASDVLEGTQALINSIYAVSFATSYFIMVYIKERESRSKLLQKASGLSSAVMWGCAFVHDYIMYIIISIFIVVALILSQTPGHSYFSDIGRSYLLLLFYGVGALPLVYLTAYLFSSPSRGFLILFFVNLIAGMAFIVFEMLRLLANIDNIDDIVDGIEIVLYIFPYYSYTAAMWNMASIHTSNAQCRSWCNSLNITECTAERLREAGIHVRCLEDLPFFGWNNPGISRALVYMLISGIILFALLMVIEYRLLPTVNWCNPPIKERPYRFVDNDVEMEKQRVEEILQSPNQVFKLISRALKRQYKNYLAVNGVSFAVDSGECFGLLGTNGAGKTSTFKMLTGDLQITAGQAWVHGYSVNNDIKNVYKYIGYCPQFDALFDSLTGLENLIIYCWLKGIPIPYTRLIINDLSKKLGFHRYLNKVVSKYSGGNKRKLSTAIALLGDTPLVFLDEPTTGMDPAAKRQLWEVILEQTRMGRSVVLTSHSMEECQALCSRLTVMVDGEFRCIGSPQHLKNKFSQGCTITIQLAQNDAIQRNDSNEQLAELQDYLKVNFGNLEVKEIAQGLISYNIRNQNVQWSKLFGILERAKERQIIEDYSINQTTLEEVFLQFTKLN